jgi:hypothetical protein
MKKQSLTLEEVREYFRRELQRAVKTLRVLEHGTDDYKRMEIAKSTLWLACNDLGFIGPNESGFF